VRLRPSKPQVNWTARHPPGPGDTGVVGLAFLRSRAGNRAAVRGVRRREGVLLTSLLTKNGLETGSAARGARLSNAEGGRPPTTGLPPSFPPRSRVGDHYFLKEVPGVCDESSQG
jgi:hypothetical protein